MKRNIKSKHPGLLFGEGRKDKKFLDALTDLDKFVYHTKDWAFRRGSAHGGSPYDVLKCCKNAKIGTEKLTLCFIDLDVLKQDCLEKEWLAKKKDLEKKALEWGIKIIWQIDKAEDEYKKVLGKKYEKLSKHKINKVAREQIDKFINSPFWKKILKPIKDCEKALESTKKPPTSTDETK